MSRTTSARSTERRAAGVALACALVAAGCGGDPGHEAPPAPKNLLFLCLDTLRHDQLGVYGAEPSPSPRIDAFARSAVVFERAVAHASWTLPSFAAVLTSLYASTLGTWTFYDPLPEAYRTLPEIFQEAGFDTYGIASHVFFRAPYGLLQGFDGFDEELAKRQGHEGWDPVTSPGVTDKAVAWLDARAARDDPDPFLLWLHYFDPHFPYVDHTGRAGGDLLAAYRGEIAFTDGHVGRVLDALARDGFLEETVVVLLSDHGEAFGEHPGSWRHGKNLHWEQLQVPLVVRVPGLAPRRVAGTVRTVDLFPTLLELFGLEAGDDRHRAGVSLVPALRGEPHDTPPMLAEIRLHEGHHASAVVHGRWKLIEERPSGRQRLYDLDADPLERRDLATAEPERTAALAAELRQLVAEAEAAAAPTPEAVEVAPDTLDHLRALGYVDDDGGEGAR